MFQSIIEKNRGSGTLEVVGGKMKDKEQEEKKRKAGIEDLKREGSEKEGRKEGSPRQDLKGEKRDGKLNTGLVGKRRRVVGKDDLGRSQPKISQFFQGSGKIARNREGSKEANVKEEGIEGGKRGRN